MYGSTRKGLNQVGGDSVVNNNEDSRTEKQKDIYSEIADIFPALLEYKTNHNITNLKKLMFEVGEFCKSIYASTQNEDERKAYRSTISKLNK